MSNHSSRVPKIKVSSSWAVKLTMWSSWKTTSATLFDTRSSMFLSSTARGNGCLWSCVINRPATLSFIQRVQTRSWRNCSGRATKSMMTLYSAPKTISTHSLRRACARLCSLRRTLASVNTQPGLWNGRLRSEQWRIARRRSWTWALKSKLTWLLSVPLRSKIVFKTMFKTLLCL